MPAQELSSDKPRPSIGRKLLLPLAVCAFAAGLLAAFYAFENWRGARAWRLHRERLRAAGEKMDWAKFIPTPPPAESNIMKFDPRMEDWFIKGRAPKTNSATANAPTLVNLSAARVRLATIEVVRGGAPAFNEIRDNPSARAKILDEMVGRRMASPLVATLFLRNGPPPTVRVAADPLPTARELGEALQRTNAWVINSPLAIENVSENSFAVYGDKSAWLEANEFLEAKPETLEQLKTLRLAAKRPFTFLEGDYSAPERVPVPNFVTMRTLTQVAATRAQAYLLMKNAERAFDEVTCIQDVRRLGEAEPPILVTTMIDVAVARVYQTVVEAGFAENIWTERELVTFLREPRNANFIGRLNGAMRTDRASISQMIMAASRKEFADRILRDDSERWWKRKSTYVRLMPQGWIDQGLTLYSDLCQSGIDAFDPTAPRVSTDRMRTYRDQVESAVGGLHPKNLIAAAAIPNMEKGSERAAIAQTFGAFIQIAAALELRKRKDGAYPENLDALVPAYLQKVPREFVKDAPFHYRRVGDSYILYSVGWDGRDDFSPLLDAFEKNPGDAPFPVDPSFTEDWVWRGAPPLKESAPALSARGQP